MRTHLFIAAALFVAALVGSPAALASQDDSALARGGTAGFHNLGM